MALCGDMYLYCEVEGLSQRLSVNKDELKWATLRYLGNGESGNQLFSQFGLRYKYLFFLTIKRAEEEEGIFEGVLINDNLLIKDKIHSYVHDAIYNTIDKWLLRFPTSIHLFFNQKGIYALLTQYIFSKSWVATSFVMSVINGKINKAVSQSQDTKV